MSTRAPFARVAYAREEERQTRATAAERARLREHAVGGGGVLTACAEDLARIRRDAAALRLKNRKLLEQVRELQARPSSRNPTKV